jgi:hypothetical protein
VRRIRITKVRLYSEERKKERKKERKEEHQDHQKHDKSAEKYRETERLFIVK